MVDPATYVLNITLIVVGLVLMTVLFLVTIVTWSSLRAWMWHRQQHRAREDYGRKTRRADGRKYPPYWEGVCEQCGRGDRKIYHVNSGPSLCPPCYEAYWRHVKTSKAAEAVA